MDRIRYFAELSVRRAAAFGLLAIAVVAVGLSFDGPLALQATAILLTIECLVLWQFGTNAGRTPYQRREVWLLLDGKHGLHEAQAQRIISEIMAESFRHYARKMAGPAAACWVVALASRLLG